MKGVVGAAFIITPPYASRPMDSWWPNGIVFPLSPSRQSWITNARAAARIPARGSPRSPRAAKSARYHYHENGLGPILDRRDRSVPLLRVAFRLILGVNIRLHNASCWARMIWSG